MTTVIILCVAGTGLLLLAGLLADRLSAKTIERLFAAIGCGQRKRRQPHAARRLGTIARRIFARTDKADAPLPFRSC